MKRAIIGLAALAGAGCATAAHEMPRFETAVRAEPAAEQAPLYSDDMSLPSETFSYDTAYRTASEEIVTMGPHGYTISCGRAMLIHTENQPVHDVFFNPVVNGGCENLLVIARESGSQRWIDTGCEGLLDVYEELTADNEPFARESPVGESNTALYGAHFNLLLAEEVDAIWRARWNIQNRREVIHWWNYPRE